MAKQAIPEELDSLIQEYLTDGVITAKERQVLLRKAEKLGLDVDEIDLYIDAQQQKVDQQTDAAVRKQRGQSCPYCGGSVAQLTDKCPHCGQHITVQASDDLKEIIENLENALVDLKDSKNFERNKALTERYVRKAKMYYSNNPKIKILVEEINKEVEDTEKKYKKQNTWIKKHPYWATFIGIALLIIILCIIWGSNENFDEDGSWWLPIMFLWVPGLIIAIASGAADGKKRQEQEQ